jgi:hypothetical protein
VTDPASTPAGYSGTPLPRKLGIKPEDRVILVGAPARFDLGPLPPGARVEPVSDAATVAAGAADVTVVFCRDRATLVASFGPLKLALAPSASLWVAWPKRAAKVPTDLDESFVRAHGLACGLVDVKVCAVDQTWSGLKFVYRLADRATVSSTQA